MAVLLLAGLLGLLGHGPLSTATAASPTLRVHYHRFERLDDHTSITFEVMDAGSGRDLPIWIGRDLLDAFEIVRAVPEARHEQADDAGVTYWFAGEPRSGPRRITFYLDPRRAGGVSGLAMTGGGRPVAFRQFVYP